MVSPKRPGRASLDFLHLLMKITRAVKKFLTLLLTTAIAGCQTTGSFNFGSYSQAEKLYAKGQYGKAIAKYEEYIRENPEGNMAVISRYYLAKSYENLGQIDKARETYEGILKEHKGLVWADFSKARIEELKARSEPARGKS